MEIIKVIHSVSGMLVGITGLLQILFKKGGKQHRNIGRVYFIAWIFIILTGGYLGSLLITFFGILGFYMAFTGFRLGHNKCIEMKVIDSAAIWLAMMFSLATAAWGILLLIKGNSIFGIIAVFFGIIFMIISRQDYLKFIKRKSAGRLSGHRLEWMFEHYSRMYISYIAALTAFTVIQEIFVWEILNWVAPTFIGTALIILSNRYYYKRYKIE